MTQRPRHKKVSQALVGLFAGARPEGGQGQ